MPCSVLVDIASQTCTTSAEPQDQPCQIQKRPQLGVKHPCDDTDASPAASQACTACRSTGHSLAIWRANAGLKPAECEALDRDHGSGWNLAAALLRPRQVQVSPCLPCLQAGQPCLRVEALSCMLACLGADAGRRQSLSACWTGVGAWD